MMNPTKQPGVQSPNGEQDGFRGLSPGEVDHLSAERDDRQDHSQLLHRLIEAQVNRAPQHEALRFEGQSLTYAELESRANQCAHYLRELGVGPDTIVGVYMERSLELVVALLAILKAGGAYLPLDTTYPAARLRFLLEDADVPVVLTQQRHTDRLHSFAATVLALDSPINHLASYAVVAPEAVNQPDDLAYVIYTSGSTGQPKGCLLSHRAICNRLLWMQAAYGLRPHDRVLQKTPYTFDVSVWEFFWPLLAGATMVLAAPQGHKDSHYLVSLIRRESITMCHFVPSMLRFFLNDPGAPACLSLRDAFTSGEALPFDLVRRFKELLPARLHNLYGPTEAAVDVSYWACEIRPDHKVPIGRAIRNIRLYVLDAQRQPVPQGHEGELYIAGVGLARGYLRRPQLTAERFVDDPFYPGQKMYRTGDRVVELDDGNIDFLGRIDFQVKLRGLRIELGEIESLLRQYEGVTEAAVLVRGEDEGDPKLVAYLEVPQGLAVESGRVRRFVADQLPEYMVPNLVLALPQLPVTVHGKLDRAALPWPLPAGVPAAAEVATTVPVSTGACTAEPASLPEAPPSPTPPLTSTPAAVSAPVLVSMQSEIGAMVASVLRQDQIAAEADLFDLGATSLTLVRVVEKIRTAFGVAVPLDVFLDAPTVASIAAYVARCLEAVRPVHSAEVSSARVSQAASGDTPDGVKACTDNVQFWPLRPVRYRKEAGVQQLSANCFSRDAVRFEDFSAWLGRLRAGSDEQGQSKYLYPSGGGLNPVRAYVWVRDGGVQGLPGGAYYYHPEQHALHTVGDTSLSASGAGQISEVLSPSRGADAAFVLVLVAEMAAIEPLYREASATLVALDAGYMSQLLLADTTAHGLVVRPASDLALTPLSRCLNWSPTERFVHGLLAGVSSGNGDRVPAVPGRAFGDPLCVRHGVAEAAFSGQAEMSISPEQLKQERRHLRPLAPQSRSYPLADTHFAWTRHRLRACCRDYQPQAVGLDALAGLLGLARGTMGDDGQGALYGASGSRLDLTVAVYVRGGELPEGLYRYDAAQHRLVALGGLSAAQVEQIYTPYNRKHFKQASFVLFVLGRCDLSNDPQRARHVALLDAGSLGQLWMERQAEFGLGLCPIGAVRFERIRAAFDLEAGLDLLHSFVGGVSSREVPNDWPRIEVVPTAVSSVAPAVRPQVSAHTQSDDVAIVGLSGRYPGAGHLAQFWHNLQTGVCSVGPLPESRRRGAADAQWPLGGYLPDIASFDSLLFGIAPVEARGLDPQERLLLEEVWACLEEAGYTAESLVASHPRVGVFVGAMWNDYQSVGLDSWRAKGRVEEFSHHASLANRISHVFDFAGPSLAVNTSCASGLTALHWACESLRRGECDAAIVGGVNLLAHPYHAQLLADLGMLSTDGLPRPLSAQASGWAPGEGVGAVLLKPLERAERDGDHVHALIRASHVGHSGRSSRYGAPSVNRQVEHLRQLLTRAALAPQDIDYIEATAPGASLADAAEMTALNEVFGQVDRSVPCYVGTVKGHIGHLESASGLSQLTKVVMQLKQAQLAPTLGSEPRSPFITLNDDRLSVVTQAMPWSEPVQGGVRRPRQALINAIGAAGSCCHLVVAEYLPASPHPTAAGSAASARHSREAVLLSAATAEQLGQQLARLHDFLSDTALPGLSLEDLAWTLRVGRMPMAHRLALVVSDLAELRQRLAHWCNRGVNRLCDADEQAFEGAPAEAHGASTGDYLGVVDDGSVTHATTPLTGADPDRLAAAWVRGLPVDWRAFDRPGLRRVSLPTYPFEVVRHWLDSTPVVASEAGPAPVPQNHAHTDDDKLHHAVHAYLMAHLAEATEIPLNRISLDRPLEALGLNSLVIQALNARLAPDWPGLPKTLFFEHRTLRSVAQYLWRAHRPVVSALFGGDERSVSPTAAVASPVVSVKPAAQASCTPVQEIAIIGLAGRYPQADTLDAFWQQLAAGKDCIQPVPASRWDAARIRLDAPTGLCPWGGFLNDVDAFDPLFFNISPLEAERMDPQERLMLQTAWQVLEDAGHSRAMMETRYQGRVGVFVGVMYSEYQLLAQPDQALGITGSFGSIANRVSYVLNLHGPSMAVDTMCSSSLTAIHLACDSIRRGDCACAIAGGVNLSLHPNKYITHALLNMPSSDGRCRSFGEGGDGFVPGEGVGAVLLKPLAQALADGDPIYGVVKASSVNHGGKTNGYTVPNPDAQQALVAEALRRAGVNARAISYVEAHGTGTALGDPIEMAGLSRAFAEHTADRQFCAIGSVKSNIGHAEAAAGMAGLTKVLLQMKHGQLVPSLHSRCPNPNIDFNETPFVVQQTLADWPRPVLERDGQRVTGPRLAGISSFGAGGANAHVIIEEPACAAMPTDPAASPPWAQQAALVVLSAKNADRLHERVAQLLAVIDAGSLTDECLWEAAYTLQVGRDPMESRLALAVPSTAVLRQQLQSVLQEGRPAAGVAWPVYRGEVKKGREAVDALQSREPDVAARLLAQAAQGQSEELLQWWVQGLLVDWSGLYGVSVPRRISLPTYPFARERCWLPESPAHTGLTGLAGADSAHSSHRVPTATAHRFDRAFFEQLFRDLDRDHLSVDAAWAQARKKIERN